MYKFVILLFLSITLISNCQVYKTPVLNPTNKHYYQIVNETLDGIAATEKCSSMTYNGLKGYLATFTSEDEWNWSVSAGITGAGAWISGSDAIKTGVWANSNGSPEGGQPMYNLYFDKCYTFCLFGNVEPNLIVGEHWVHTSGTAAAPYWNNNGYKAVIANTICEYGGLEEPFVPASPTQGSNVIVSNLNLFDISKLTITFTGRDTATTFTCSPIVKINTTHASCDIPAGQGRYTYLVTDGTKTSTLQYWHYELPYVSGVVAAFTAGATVNITGGNFGIDASKITISLGSSPNLVSCGSIKLIKANEALTCVLATAITGKFLPVTITVSNSNFVSYKAAVWYPDNKKFYSGFISSSTFDLSMTNYSGQLRVDGQVGHIGVYDSKLLAEFIQKTLPVPIVANVHWLVWQNVYYNPTTSTFRYLTGPNIDKDCPLYYLTPTVKDSSWTTATRFIINTTDFSLTAFAGSASTFTEFGGYAPSFTYPGRVNSISPAGGIVNLALDNYGTVFSTIVVTMESIATPLTFTRDFVAGELIVTIPPGFDGPYDISVNVDGLSTVAGTQKIDYYAPVINTINRVPTTGGVITIDGLYFSNSLSNTVLTFGSVTCSSLSLVTSYSRYQCTLPASSGSKSVTLKVSSKTSTPYTYQYQNPTVTSANNIPQIGGVVTIEGTNFGTVANDITVSIVSYVCSGISIITPHTKISCNAPIGTPSTYGLIVTVATLPSNSFSMYYFSSDRTVKQVGSDILISGTDLPISTSLSISIGTIDISSNCIGSGVLITCSNLPTTVISGNLIMFKGSDIYPIIPIQLIPYISSISNNLLDTISTTTITLSGRYFEKVTNGITNEIVVQQNGITLSTSNFNYIDSQTMTVIINGGFGKGFKLTINVGSRVSNQVEYSFYAPELKTVSHSGSNVTITGSNFSSTTTIVTYGIYQPVISFINSNIIKFELIDSSRNGQIYVTVESQKSNELTLNLTPYLDEIVLPKPNIQGPTSITITGDYLYNVDSLGNSIALDFYYQFKTVGENTAATKLTTCNPSSSVSRTYICDMVSGYGYFDLYVISNSQIKSNVISGLEYVSPIVGKATSIYKGEPGTITISVENIDVQHTTITIGTGSCSNIVLVNSTAITCYFGATVSYPEGSTALDITVNSAGLIDISENGFTYIPLFGCPTSNQLECSGNGICNPKSGLCQCNTNWNKTDCSNDMTLIDCPNNCTNLNQGTCDRKTGLCHCETGFEGLDCSNYTCPNDCSNQGKCDVTNGYCTCDLMFEGLDCSNHTCPNNCSLQGTCDKSNGYCTCDIGFEGIDCSNYTCPNDCSNQGLCDKSNGYCTCYSTFQSLDCSIPFYPCLNDCTSILNGQCNNQTGECTCTPSYQGLDCSDHTCPNNCSLQGTCDKSNGKCFCYSGKGGLDCSIDITKEPGVIPPIIDGDGVTTFPGKNSNTTVSITHLREMNINNQPIKTLALKDIQWIEKSNISSNQHYYKGQFNNDTVIFELVIKYFESPDEIQFAGQFIEFPGNSVKYLVHISNWSFSMQTNYLQTIYLSKTDKITTYKCDEIESTSNVGSNDFQIENGESIFNATFAKNIIVDDTQYYKSTIVLLDDNDVLYSQIQTKDTEYNILTSVDSPYFKKSVILDPLFSSLFRETEVTECGSTNKWKIPVIVVLSTVGGLSVAGATAFVVKNKISQRKLEDSISMSRKKYLS